MKNMDNFQKELSVLINKYCLDSEANTPDFVLANFLYSCVQNYIECNRQSNSLGYHN